MIKAILLTIREDRVSAHSLHIREWVSCCLQRTWNNK